MTEYVPRKRENPILMTKMPTAWGDIPTILKDIIDRFNVKQNVALELLFFTILFLLVKFIEHVRIYLINIIWTFIIILIHTDWEY